MHLVGNTLFDYVSDHYFLSFGKKTFESYNFYHI
jgi:hypothetical protein